MGIINGVSIPVHGAQNDLFCVNIATDCMDAALQAPLQQLRLMSVHLQTSYIRLFKDNREDDALFPSLTGRERDCLTLCALGKTSWEIGEILGISELTVNSYINNASTKLDANSRIFAVVKAIRLGLINP
jgi:LuxR family quorum-sensing transcriptional regulator LasR/LuxR family quorum-sensing system transcriptional regulator CciR